MLGTLASPTSRHSTGPRPQKAPRHLSVIVGADHPGMTARGAPTIKLGVGGDRMRPPVVAGTPADG
jgi:hypothetical protein